MGDAASDERHFAETHRARRAGVEVEDHLLGEERVFAVREGAQRKLARVALSAVRFALAAPFPEQLVRKLFARHHSLAKSRTAVATAFRPRITHVATVPKRHFQTYGNLLVAEPLEVEHRKRFPLPVRERLDRRTNGRIPARFGNSLERVIRRIGQALDERGKQVPLLVGSVTGVPRPRPLSCTQRVERDVAGDPDHPGAHRFAFTEALVPLDRAAEGLICTVLHVRMIDPFADDARDDGAHERPERSLSARKKASSFR